MRVVIDGVGEHAMRVVIDGVGEQSAGYLHVRLAAGERDEVHVAHAGLEAEDLLPVAAREHTHLPSEGSFAPSKPIRANQSQSEVVHLPSEAIRGHPRSSVSISAYPRQSECNQSTIRVQSECNQSAIRGQSEGNESGDQVQSEAIRGNHGSSEAFGCNQGALWCNQRHSGAIRCDQVRSGALTCPAI